LTLFSFISIILVPEMQAARYRGNPWVSAQRDKNMSKVPEKRILLGRERGYLSAATTQYRFIIFLLITLGVYTFLLKVFQKLAEIVQLSVFFPIALVTLLLFIGIVGTMYSHTFAGPLARIRRALDQVADGDTGISLRLRDSDDPLLKDLVSAITKLCECSRNHSAQIHEAASSLRTDIVKLQEKVHANADKGEVQALIDGLRRKQDVLDAALKSHGKVNKGQE
jgi:hypothetical protein